MISIEIETYRGLYEIINKMESISLTKKHKNKPLMILGPSAVGKDTMINRLKSKFPNVIYKLPSYTTRPKREGETDGLLLRNKRRV